MKKILILFAHPALEKSRVNRALVDQIQQLTGVTFHDLYEHYPDFDIDIEREQELMETHDIVVFHHPFFWYSIPSILKEWQDLVLVHGWAYGTRGTALRGKQFLNLVTTGGGERAYQKDGHNRFTMRELLAPIEQTSHLCGMSYLPPFVVHGTHSLTSEEIRQHAQDCKRFLEGLRDDRIDLKAACDLPRINLDLNRIIIQ
jgi:glutathione-regulated potassium-efflux system ancillary protein KefG